MKVPTVRTNETLAEASRGIAEAIREIAREAVAARGRCAIALAGGHTPETLYQMLAEDFSSEIPWTNVHVFWSDERCIPAGDPDSNYGMARRTLLNRVPCPQANVHPMPAELSPAAGAAAYEHTLRRFFGDAEPRFDVMLLGVGGDGHTASLFPHATALHETKVWVLATTSAVKPAARLTLTFPIINQARTTFVLAAGEDKIAVVDRVLADDADPDVYPAARLRESTGHVVWCLARVP